MRFQAQKIEDRWHCIDTTTGESKGHWHLEKNAKAYATRLNNKAR
jgi:hypothetical protein